MLKHDLVQVCLGCFLMSVGLYRNISQEVEGQDFVA